MYLQVTGLKKSFTDNKILDNISFTISGNEKVGLLGKNGSGKSTLLKLIVGQEETDSGIINTSSKNTIIGYLPQTDSLSADIQLSSGERVKNQLKEILSQKPNLLLLDEPTNHLDWKGLLWLEEIVNNFDGPVLITSHDRKFLDNTVSKIIELDSGKIKIYGGNYSFYKEQKAKEEEANLKRYKDQRKRLNKLGERTNILKNQTQQLEMETTGADHYKRRKAAKAASAAINIQKRIAKEVKETTIKKPETNWELKALFKPGEESSKTVVSFHNVSKSFGERKILKQINLVIQQKQRIALLGDNGSGKTTLIKLLLKEILPDNGEITYGNNLQIGYLSQEHQELNNERIVLDELTCDGADKTIAYKLLHRFLLTPDKINQPVRLLSSGEKSKLLLAKIMLSQANFIILDEPTNHLDIPSCEAIEEAFSNYSGTLLVVSHDRYFLQKVGINDVYFLQDGNLVKD